MYSLFKIEWLKLKTYRTFWAILLLFVVLFPVANILLANLLLKMKGANKMTQHMIVNYFAFPQVWRAVSYVGGYFLTLPAILVIILVTNEYTFRTHRQNVIDGLSRNQFVTAKLTLALLLACLSAVLVIITAFLLGYLYTEAPLPANIFTNFYLVGYFFLQTLFYLLLAFLIAMMFKRSGISIGIFLLFTLVIDSIIESLMNRYLNNSGYFFVTAPADQLVPNPFLDLAKGSGLFEVPFSDSTFLIVTLIYVSLLAYFLFWRFRRVDL